jgi:3-oxoacyl-[acyl-carrier-protein] synthase II
MPERVAITGIGCISCFGMGHAAFAAAAAAGTSGAASVARFETSGCRCHRAALVRDFDPAAFIPPLKLRRIDAVGRLALVASRLLFEDAGWTPGAEGSPQGEDIGIALGTATAGLDSLVEYLGDLTDRGPGGVPAILFSNTVSNAPASLCAIEFGLRGPNVTFNQREASSASALAYAVGAIRSGRSTAMVTGGADWVEETLFKVFDRFGALSTEDARPFDRRRQGFTLGEGSYLVLLESAAAAAARGARVYGEIVGVGAAASKTALNAWPADGAGIARAMREALADAGLTPDSICAVIAAANGSPVLDRVEAEAIVDVFGARRVPVASIKGAVGESGAAGAAGLIAALLSLKHCSLVPTAGLIDLDPALGIAASAEPQPTGGATFLINAVASGGTNYSLAVRTAGRG